MPRGLRTKELDEAEFVFANNLIYEQIRIYESSKLPLWVSRIGSLIAGEDPPIKNAITLRNKIYFSENLETSPFDIQGMNLTDMAWLIHELTHAWQYQHIGIRYLYDAIQAQIKLGSKVYDYGNEQGLKNAHQAGNGLLDFNPEQQGEIARDYYIRIKNGQDVTAWTPFIHELKTLPM